jgi:hypothetical protein
MAGSRVSGPTVPLVAAFMALPARARIGLSIELSVNRSCGLPVSQETGTQV